MALYEGPVGDAEERRFPVGGDFALHAGVSVDWKQTAAWDLRGPDAEGCWNVKGLAFGTRCNRGPE